MSEILRPADEEREYYVRYDSYGDLILPAEERKIQEPFSSAKALHLSLARSRVPRLTFDPLRWHQFIYDEQQKLLLTAPEFFAGFTFDLRDPAKPWSPELNHTIGFMRHYGRLVIGGTAGEGHFYYIPQDARDEIETDLSPDYREYNWEVNTISGDINTGLRFEGSMDLWK